jgi:hypothetical protein
MNSSAITYPPVNIYFDLTLLTCHRQLQAVRYFFEARK